MKGSVNKKVQRRVSGGEGVGEINDGVEYAVARGELCSFVCLVFLRCGLLLFYWHVISEIGWASRQNKTA